MNARGIWAITVHTFREAIRTKWLWVYTATFFLLALNLPFLFLLAVRYLPPNYLDVYLGALVTLSFPFLPLLALPIGATSIVEERESGSLQYVLATPITKTSFLVGRLLGLLLATTTVVVLGFGAAAAITFSTNVSRYSAVISVGLIGALLNAVMVALSLLISVLTRRKATALGVAIFFWFFFSIFSNLGLLTVVINLAIGPTASVELLLLDPVETARVLAVIVLGAGSEQLGSTGFTLVHVLGDSTREVVTATLLAWFGILFAATFLLFRHQDVA